VQKEIWRGHRALKGGGTGRVVMGGKRAKGEGKKGGWHVYGGKLKSA